MLLYNYHNHCSHFTPLFFISAALFTLALFGRAAYGQSTTVLGNPVIHLPYFDVRGTTLHINSTTPALTGDGTIQLDADLFYGVPFAQPPQRFELAKPLKAHGRHRARGGEPLDCTTFASIPRCYARAPSAGANYSEDCLKLIIERPAGTSADAKLPVLVYIHSGAFVGGWAISFVNSYAFTEHFVSEGIIMVHIQYRLAMLGFGWDGTEDGLRGNYGLHDQQLALQWIHENIHAFGGDPDQITIWGSSAGSASVAYHTIHPDSYPYFARAIEQSGSYDSSWARPNDRSLAPTAAIAAAVGCGNSTAGPALKACLQTVNVSAIFAANAHLSPEKDSLDLFMFGPRSEGPYWKGSKFEEALADAPPKPSIISYNTDESISFAGSAPFAPLTSLENATAVEAYIRNHILPNPSLSDTPHLETVVEQVRDALVNFYLATEANSLNVSVDDPIFDLKQYIHFLTDIQIVVAALWEARAKAQHGWPVYVYHFDYVEAAAVTSLPYRAVPHTIDAGYMLLTGPLAIQRTLDVQREMVSSFVAFVKNGQPTATWPLFQFSGHCCTNATEDYTAWLVGLEGSQPEYGNSDNARRMAFWDGLSAEYNLRHIAALQDTQGQCLPRTCPLSR